MDERSMKNWGIFLLILTAGLAIFSEVKQGETPQWQTIAAFLVFFVLLNMAPFIGFLFMVPVALVTWIDKSELLWNVWYGAKEKVQPMIDKTKGGSAK